MLRDELIALLERLRRTGCDLREIEVKRAERQLPEKLWKTLSAFANATGGILLLGVDESAGFEVVGVSNPAKIQADLASLCDQMEPPLRPVISVYDIEGRQVVVAEVPQVSADQKPCYYRPAGIVEGSYIRVADGDRRLTDYEVQLFLSWRQRPRFDRQPVHGKSLSDLNKERIQEFLKHVRTYKPYALYQNWSDEQLLRTFGIVVEQGGVLTPTLAGYLCFADFPQDEFPGLHLTVVRYPSIHAGQVGHRGERLLENVKVEGSIVDLVMGGMKVILRNLQNRVIVSGLFAETIPEYPQEFLREVLVNAVAHRDYSAQAQGTPVQVRLFPDRIEVENPGGLFGPVTVDRLGEPGLTAARNETLMRILEDLPAEEGRTLCENRGTGIVSMLEALRQAGLQPPRFDDLRTTFKVTATNATLLDEPTVNWLNSLRMIPLSDEQRLILAYTYKTGQVTHADVRRLHPSLDAPRITRILADLVAKGLLEQLGVRRWTVYTLGDRAIPRRMPAKLKRQTIRENLLQTLASGGELSAIELAEQLGIKAATVRYHLRRLRQEGLVEPTTDKIKSPEVRYRLTSPHDR
ncbi:MAG: putative DNA binding domain-containing protein [Armatimonadetes bacterium]|nr:putative DNA binding domain-containing protein [Armatimonadota bacterium]CUU37754.1 ATP-dependent DNA helicase RecG [Armatimonadetes bacterium DC]